MSPGSGDGGTGGQPLRKKDRGRPLLSASGRKLRHLNGIAIRNVSEIIPPRPHGKSNDDTSIAGSWRSPKQILSVQEEAAIQHSRSSSDLVSMSIAAQASSGSGGGPPASLRIPGRRRRSTRVDMEDPLSMQKFFEEAPSTRLPDTFFTLHHASVGEEPLYISEIIKKSANPTFCPFDLLESGPAISWLDSVIVKVWVNSSDGDKFKLLLELDISLFSLQFIGTAIENFRQPLPQNCVIFSLTDGVYTTLTDAPLGARSNSASRYKIQSHEELKDTSSYDSLMKLKNLEECIWDAQITRDKLSRSIETILEREKPNIDAIRLVGKAKDDLQRAQTYLSLEKSRFENVVRQRDQLQESLDARKDAVAKGIEQRKNTEKHLVEAKIKLVECKEMLKSTAEGITGQQRRVITELQKIYPIEPIPEKTLAFTIRGLHLPNTEFEDQNEETIAAALGYTAHLVYLLSFYLRVYLRYPVQPMGSNSFIRDPISVIQGSRMFPLWPKGQVSYRFEYAVFLLNKNIEMLLSSQSIVVMDLRSTLPNLKYLLYIVTSSGKTPIPDREWPTAPFRLKAPRGIHHRGDPPHNDNDNDNNNSTSTGHGSSGNYGKPMATNNMASRIVSAGRTMMPGTTTTTTTTTTSTSPVSSSIVGDFAYPRLHRERSIAGIQR
ncbi:UV radiation resistance protein and autophagy-related subunit 14-domain-containing protein [Peziza echinospora]|nr:UV radiation resistance protein and autophagy-related subunit 14-domain-containing protein [Peziza echinospora]